jgi:two-component system cell cycle sensor histidine kinase/response regulator CckA
LLKDIEERKTRSEPEMRSESVTDSRDAILLIEDDNLLREAVALMLESRGFRILTAVDGEEGHELYSRHYHEIGAVVCDWKLPGINGMGVFRMLKRIDPSIVFFLASGFMDDGVRAEALQHGIKECLEKPYKSQDLLRVAGSIPSYSGCLP